MTERTSKGTGVRRSTSTRISSAARAAGLASLTSDVVEALAWKNAESKLKANVKTNGPNQKTFVQ
jgi:hypothetical protein